MITPKAFPTVRAKLADLWRRLTLPPAAFEEARISQIHRHLGGAISREEVRRIVRTHRI
jgi:hypothetical protein